ncbi:hypothetical protein EQG49_12295 [Periweissella cryptocerci]|uniref:Uncharacterized protein n=1 Tax=Periweissella cryptocerci TaxID=2506420 RepID=A0A4P6YWG9_9LACO|nr:hypothetical protein [Periweissella cryptocerci]QBO37178.1 hypothetical protein EQG49_12295 [Periweissella cryptocerci]
MQKKGIIGIAVAIILLGGGTAGYYYHEQATQKSSTSLKAKTITLTDQRQADLNQFGFAFDKHTKGEIINNRLLVTVDSDKQGKFAVNFQVKTGYGFTSASIESKNVTIDQKLGGIAPTTIVTGQLTKSGLKEAKVSGVIKLRGIDKQATVLPMTLTVNNKSTSYQAKAQSNLELALGNTEAVAKVAKSKAGQADYNKQVAATAVTKQAKREQAMANSSKNDKKNNSANKNTTTTKSGSTGTVTAMMSRQGYTGIVVAMDNGGSKAVVMHGGASVSVGQHVSVSASAPTYETYTTKAGKTYSGYVSWGSVSPAGK